MRKPPERDRRSTPIAGSRVHKGKIESPFGALTKVAPVKLISWYKDSLPEYLWLTIGFLPQFRTKTLAALRPTLLSLNKYADDDLILYQHSFLAGANDEFLELLLRPFVLDIDLRNAISAVSLIPDLPGREIWLRYFGHPKENALDQIEEACSYACPQDGRAATDIAFIDAVSQLLQGKLHVPPDIFSADAINTYARNPEEAEIDGFLRALRNSSRMSVAEEEASIWPASFYAWGRSAAQCWSLEQDSLDESTLKLAVASAIKNIDDLQSICVAALTTDFIEHGPDDSRETTAGICLYACDLATFICMGSAISFSSGWMALRTLAECAILLSHLKLFPSEVERYRQYGAGRAKLMVNKSIELGEMASSFNFDEMSAVANERKDELFTDMPLSSFYQPNLRDVSIKSGTKEIYDKFYDIASAYTHADWGACATVGVQMCVNPLHLGHYIPSQRSFPVEAMEDVSWLIEKLKVTLQEIRKVGSELA